MADTDQPERMRCMEVWGGNVQTDRRLQTTGLDVWISSQPEGQARAGGDVYYVSSCASGRITRLLLADVAGHGHSVAEVAADLRDLMRKNVNTIGHQPFVIAMNRHFADATDGLRFATAIVSSFFAPTRSLSICNAGHPPPFLFRAAEQRWTTLDTQRLPPGEATMEVSDLPLGIVPDTRYSEFTTRLEKGDMVLSYSDAFSEAQGTDGQLLGVEGLLSRVAAEPFHASGEFFSSLIASIKSLNPANLQDDDATLLLFRANGSQTSLRDNLLAPFRLLGHVDDASQIVPTAGSRRNEQ